MKLCSLSNILVFIINPKNYSNMFEKIIKSQMMLQKHRQQPLARERESYLEDRCMRGVSLSKLRSEAGYLLDAVKILKLTDSDCSNISLERVIWCTQVWSRNISLRHPDASRPKSKAPNFEQIISRCERNSAKHRITHIRHQHNKHPPITT